MTVVIPVPVFCRHRESKLTLLIFFIKEKIMI
jgi:hypothetical protein